MLYFVRCILRMQNIFACMLILKQQSVALD